MVVFNGSLKEGSMSLNPQTEAISRIASLPELGRLRNEQTSGVKFSKSTKPMVAFYVHQMNLSRFYIYEYSLVSIS